MDIVDSDGQFIAVITVERKIQEGMKQIRLLSLQLYFNFFLWNKDNNSFI